MMFQVRNKFFGEEGKVFNVYAVVKINYKLKFLIYEGHEWIALDPDKYEPINNK